MKISQIIIKNKIINKINKNSIKDIKDNFNKEIYKKLIENKDQ
jgi:hypothetical protein